MRHPFSAPQAPRQPVRRRRLPRAPRRKVLILAGLGLAALGFASLGHPAPILVWNSSASAPIGLYLVLPETRPRTGDLVLVRPPAAITDLAARRGYLPRGMPLIKQVAAMGGDDVCAKDDDLSINGDIVAQRRRIDGNGRSLPRWEGCRRLLADEILLLMPAPDSLDSRYFGPLPSLHVIGRLVPLWAG